LPRQPAGGAYTPIERLARPGAFDALTASRHSDVRAELPVTGWIWQWQEGPQPMNGQSIPTFSHGWLASAPLSSGFAGHVKGAQFDGVEHVKAPPVHTQIGPQSM
jgi:hypothetical protein